MIGDKIHNSPGDYQQRMRAALDTTGVIWHGGHSREDALRIAATCDIGLGWRHPELDASLELSTKVLEYGAIGLPVILNRTPMHEELLGADYPLFAASLADVVEVAAAAAADPRLYRRAADATGRAAEQFTLDQAAERLRGYLARALPKPSPGGSDAAGAPRLRVVVAGHDLKFFTPLLDYLRLQPDLEVRLDRWAALGKHDPDASRELASWADVVICEWCGPNAVWYSRHKRRGSRLLIRLHRFELTSALPGAGQDRGGEPGGVREQALRAADPGADRLAGGEGGDRAERRSTSRSWTGPSWTAPGSTWAWLASSRPASAWTWPWTSWRNCAARMTGTCCSSSRACRGSTGGCGRTRPSASITPARCAGCSASPLLRGAVVFDDAGPDVAAWLRRVGFMLSTSDDESFHVAPAEGMASRAVPVVRHWPGAETIYDRRWIHRDPAQMAAAIAALSDEADWRQAGDEAHAQAAAAFNLERVCEAWYRLLTTDIDPAVPDPALELLGSG